jgi:hypothetical protein
VDQFSGVTVYSTESRRALRLPSFTPPHIPLNSHIRSGLWLQPTNPSHSTRIRHPHPLTRSRTRPLISSHLIPSPGSTEHHPVPHPGHQGSADLRQVCDALVSHSQLIGSVLTLSALSLSVSISLSLLPSPHSCVLPPARLRASQRAHRRTLTPRMVRRQPRQPDCRGRPDHRQGHLPGCGPLWRIHWSKCTFVQRFVSVFFPSHRTAPHRTSRVCAGASRRLSPRTGFLDSTSRH